MQKIIRNVLSKAETVKIILEQILFLTTLGIAERVGSAQQTISDYIRKLGF